jgi:hypothetical protein
MVSSYLKNFRRNIRTLYGLLKRYDIPFEIKVLKEIENSFPYNIDLSKKFDVSFNNLDMELNHKLDGAYPQYIKDFVISFHHQIKIDCSKNFDTEDLIEEYLFEIEIVGYGQKDYFYAWHLDKDVQSITDNLTHPYYHFQGWSDKLNSHFDNDDTFGQVLITNTPRFPHPPMDLFLGIHFIINNFLKSDQCTGKAKMLLDDDYKDLMKCSQEFMWDIYFNSFSDTCSHTHFNRNKVFPLYTN